MNKRKTVSLTVVLCMIFALMMAVTVSATGDSDGVGSAPAVSDTSQVISGSESATSSESSDVSSNEQTGSDSTDSETENSSNSTSSNEVSSDSENSSEGQTSGEVGTNSSDATSSSGATSSRPNKPIYSDGGNGGNTFIEQDTSELASNNASTNITSLPEEQIDEEENAILISSEYVEDEDFIDPHKVETKLASGTLRKLFWIPASLAVLCIAALIVVNILFKKKYPKPERAARRNTRSDKPQRRK